METDRDTDRDGDGTGTELLIEIGAETDIEGQKIVTQKKKKRVINSLARINVRSVLGLLCKSSVITQLRMSRMCHEVLNGPTML